MHAITKVALEELDVAGVTEPATFDRYAAIEQVKDIRKKLEIEIGSALLAVLDLEDGSAFAELSERMSPDPSGVSRALFAFTFSTFGRLVLIWSDEFSQTELRSKLVRCTSLLCREGFCPVFADALPSHYDGRHAAWENYSWEDRFFGEP